MLTAFIHLRLHTLNRQCCLTTMSITMCTPLSTTLHCIRYACTYVHQHVSPVYCQYQQVAICNCFLVKTVCISLSSSLALQPGFVDLPRYILSAGIHVMLDVVVNHVGYGDYSYYHPFNKPEHFHNCTGKPFHKSIMY